MSNPKIHREILTLLRLTNPDCTPALFEAELQALPNTFNWTYFIERAIATHLAGYLLRYPEPAEKYFPKPVLKKVKSYQQQIQLRSSFMREEILRLTPLLNKAEIDFVLLKGWDLHFRHNTLLKERQISDIDIYIDQENLNNLTFFLQKEGFQTFGIIYKSKWHEKWLPQHAPLHAMKGQIELDIHTRAFATAHQLELALTLENCDILDINGNQIPLLHEELAGQFLALHLSKHLTAMQPFKAAQLIDLYRIEISMAGLGSREKKRIKVLESFIDRTRKMAFDSRHPYDVFYLQLLAGESLPWILKIRKFIQRIKPKSSLIKSLILAFFDIFPNKRYLTHLYGKGGYWFLNLKRLTMRTNKRKGIDSQINTDLIK